METVVLLGATGSIGQSTLDIIRKFPDRFQLLAVSGYSNINRLKSILDEFHPKVVCLVEPKPDFTAQYPSITFLFGENGLCEAASLPEADTVVMAIAGIAGLRPTLAAIQSGKRLLSANKESIVAAGELVNRELDKKNAFILPLDSEHNAIFNLLTRIDGKYVREITLTASGGPFLNKEITQTVCKEDVLDHPTWDMGNYITVNCATLMNKGFEVIEAHFLFKMDYERIKVLVHPQSLVHGIVETIDGTHFMVASPSDMRYPIALSLFYPEIPPKQFKGLDLFTRPMQFSEPDMKKFPLLKLAYDTGKAGGIMTTVLNAANEITVEAFLKDRLPFHMVQVINQKTTEAFASKSSPGKVPELEEILEIDREAKKYAMECVMGV